MSVFKRPKSKIYSYDFWIKGNRFSGSTGETDKRKAEQYCEKLRQKMVLELAKSAEFTSDRMSFEVACSRWWDEVGQHAKSDHKTILRNIIWLQDHIGKATMLEDITDSIVAKLVAKRRGEKVPHRKNARLVSPATVNRSCTEALMVIINRARRVWKVRCGDIDWSRHKLAEPKERVREASPEEERRLFDALSRGFDDFARFAILTGCRFAEILNLEWTKVDFINRRYTVTRKGGAVDTLPMSDEVYDLLWGIRHHHPTRVFTFKTIRTNHRYGQVRGKRYPITRSGMSSVFRRVKISVSISDFRFHDLRHTLATRLLRKSNLKVVQKALGHTDISTTAKYAHVVDDDLRTALNAVSPTRNPTKELLTADKPLKGKGNVD